MANGILLVETQPRSPEHVAAYHQWYDQVHIPEILGVEGFVSARRLAASEGGTFIAIYEIDGDVDVARARLAARQASGSMTPPKGVELDPGPIVRYFSDLCDS